MTADRAATYPVGASVSLQQLSTDPHPVLARLRATEPVSWVPALDGWLVTSRAGAEQVMRAPATFTVDDPRFSTARVVGPSMLSLDGPEHRRHRAPFAAAFRPAATADLAGDVLDTTTRLLDAVRADRTAELRTRLAGPLAVAVLAQTLGLRGVADADVLAWYAAIVASVAEITAGGRPTEEGAEAYRQLGQHVLQTMADETPTMVRDAADTLSLDEVVSNAAVLMFGGIDTTESMILNTLWLLLGDEAVLRRLRSEPRMLPDAVEEALRLEPAAMVVDRYATGDTVLGTTVISAGELVTVSIAGANRDPLHSKDPNRFDLDRPDLGQHLSFARGPHVCLGMDLARLEVLVAVRAVLDLPGVRLDPDRPTTPSGLVFRRPQQLWVRWD